MARATICCSISGASSSPKGEGKAKKKEKQRSAVFTVMPEGVLKGALDDG